MGNSHSQEQLALIDQEYIKEIRTGHAFFGNHVFLLSRTNKQPLICKTIIFRSSVEQQQFHKEFASIQRRPFSLIYPKMMIDCSSGLESCSGGGEVNVYFELAGKSLFQMVRTEGCLSENQAWFLLNELSKALQILSENRRAHWAISPQTIYQNQHENYLLYDSFFVSGFDTQSFLLSRKDKGELLSEKVSTMLQKGTSVGVLDGSEEDCYCLGFVMLFALTGIHAKALPVLPVERNNAVRSILEERRRVISEDMREIIVELVDLDVMQRMDNYKLRRFLKDREADIIRNEEREHERSRRVNKLDTRRETPFVISQHIYSPQQVVIPGVLPILYDHQRTPK